MCVVFEMWFTNFDFGEGAVWARETLRFFVDAVIVVVDDLGLYMKYTHLHRP